MKTVKIIIGKDGSLKTETTGYKGDSCLQATKFLEKMFRLEKIRPKPEMYETEDDSKQTMIDNTPSGWCG